MENIKQEIFCPICKTPIQWDDTYDYEIQETEKKLILEKTGTCPKCKEIVDYQVNYQLFNKKTLIIDHYKL